MKNKITGIYIIINKINKKCYIGQSIDVINRVENEHFKSLNNNKHINKHLQSSWNKYGKDNFEFALIEDCNKSELNEREKYWIAYYKSYDNKYGYNKTYGGDSVIFTPEIRLKISESRKGFKMSNEQKKKLSKIFSGKNNPNYGKKLSLETRKKISESNKVAQKGKHLSEKTKQKISNANKNKITWNKNKKNIYSKETLDKMSKSHIGKVFSEEHIKKLKQNNAHYWKNKQSPFKGKKHSKESLDKMSKSLKGRKVWNKIYFSNEELLKISNRYKNGESYYAISKDYNISRGTITRLIKDFLKKD